MLPLLQDDQDGYLRELGALETLTIHGESSDMLNISQVV